MSISSHIHKISSTEAEAPGIANRLVAGLMREGLQVLSSRWVWKNSIAYVHVEYCHSAASRAIGAALARRISAFDRAKIQQCQQAKQPAIFDLVAVA